MNSSPASSEPAAGQEADTADSRVMIRLGNASRAFRNPPARRGSLKEAAVGVKARAPRESETAAISDVSLTVWRGEILGIVGDNGSGKSTLLRLIAGVLDPTSGSVRASGRVVAMIDLSAGLHPDLSGEENILLQSALLNFSGRLDPGHVDAVLAYAGLNDFRREAVRHYSSGMIARLGFAIAVHSDPDILLVDEVLAVGDIDFQAQCLRTMREMNERGVTLILVTHQPDLAERFCSRLIWMEAGRIRMAGDAATVLHARNQHFLSRYYSRSEGTLTRERIMVDSPGRFGPGEAEITEVRLADTSGRVRNLFNSETAIRIHVSYSVLSDIPTPTCQAIIDHESGINVAWVRSPESIPCPILKAGTSGSFTLSPLNLPLLPGRYILTVALSPPDIAAPAYDMHYRLHTFHVTAADTASWNSEAAIRLAPISTQWICGS